MGQLHLTKVVEGNRRCLPVPARAATPAVHSAKLSENSEGSCAERGRNGVSPDFANFHSPVRICRGERIATLSSALAVIFLIPIANELASLEARLLATAVGSTFLVAITGLVWAGARGHNRPHVTGGMAVGNDQQTVVRMSGGTGGWG